MARARAFVVSFRKRFEAPILDGAKMQTIRFNRADGKVPRPGDRLKLFIGMRTKMCKRLGIAEVTECFPVYMDLASRHHIIEARGMRLNLREMTEFAKADGFETHIAMLNWFRETYPDERAFHGYCVRWNNLKSGPTKVVK